MCSLTEALRRIGPEAASAALYAEPSLRQQLISEEHGESYAYTKESLNDIILEMRPQGYSQADIAAFAGCSKRTVGRYMRKLGIIEDNNSRWTKREEELLRAYVRQGYRSGEIGELLGRSSGAIRNRKRKLGINKPNKPWLKEQVDFLRENYHSEMHIVDLCAGCGHTEASVKHKASELGLTKSCQRRKMVNERIRRNHDEWLKASHHERG